MINCLIVDDEPVAQDILAQYLMKYPELNLVKKCSTAFEAFEVIHQQSIELLFLDIQMPGLSGIDFIKSLKNPPDVIFTTAFSEFAAASYDLDAVDYLLKPITEERFAKSLQKFLKLKIVEVAEQKEYTYFKVSGKLLKIEHKEILYAQSIKDYIILYTMNGNLITHMTMKFLCSQLPTNVFRRVHRSYLVNRNKLTSIGRNSLTIEGNEIPIGESYRNEMLNLKENL